MISDATRSDQRTTVIPGRSAVTIVERNMGAQGAPGPGGPAGNDGAGFIPDTPWTPSREYPIATVLCHTREATPAGTGDTFVCVQAGNFGLPPATTPTHWVLFGQAGEAGPQGPSGNDGAPPASPASWRWRGAWHSTVAHYDLNDATQQAGSMWVCVAPHDTDGDATKPENSEGELWELACKRGTQGPQGAKGDRGPKGDDGAAGARGATGATGARGAKGDRGLKGDDGTNGTNGTNGKDAEMYLPFFTAADGFAVVAHNAPGVTLRSELQLGTCDRVRYRVLRKTTGQWEELTLPFTVHDGDGVQAIFEGVVGWASASLSDRED